VPPRVVLRRCLRGACEQHHEERTERELLEGQAPGCARGRVGLLDLGRARLRHDLHARIIDRAATALKAGA
jgi:hypothetical protein